MRGLPSSVASGRGAFEAFSVSRSDVVDARLNKQYIEAVVYDLQHGLQSVADLKQTVLRQAWGRNQWLKAELAKTGIPVTPLLLVQVANGERTVDDAERELIELCKVPPAAIGKHSADAPDPVLMAAIAADLSKEVLIFKQSAGTGFDAPRAFVLAWTQGGERCRLCYAVHWPGDAGGGADSPAFCYGGCNPAAFRYCICLSGKCRGPARLCHCGGGGGASEKPAGREQPKN